MNLQNALHAARVRSKKTLDITHVFRRGREYFVVENALFIDAYLSKTLVASCDARGHFYRKPGGGKSLDMIVEPESIVISPQAARKAELAGEELDPSWLVLDWEEVCHVKGWFHGGIWVSYRPTRDTSRWVCVERKRPFLATRPGSDRQIASSTKLANVVAAAERYRAKNDQEIKP